MSKCNCNCKCDEVSAVEGLLNNCSSAVDELIDVCSGTGSNTNTWSSLNLSVSFSPYWRYGSAKGGYIYMFMCEGLQLDDSNPFEGTVTEEREEYWQPCAEPHKEMQICMMVELADIEDAEDEAVELAQ